MSKIRLLHLQVLPLLSGVQNMMLSLLSGLDKDKYEIYIISKGDGALEERVKELGYTHISIESLCREIAIKDIKSAFRIYKSIREIKPRIVHTHSAKTGFLGRIIARLCRVPLVIHTIHGFPFNDYQNKVVRFFYKICESFAASFAHYNVFVNQYERDYAINKLGFNKKKTLTIYNGVQPAPIVRQFSIANCQLKIVSVLRFSPQKNIIPTIEQAIRVTQKYPDITFTFIGDGELFTKASEIVNKYNASESVILTGWCDNIIEKLNHYDIFLLNSLWEGLPISILEAMSIGMPIICSNIKGNNELVSASNGWLIDPQDPNGIENVITEILKTPETISKKGTESHSIVTNHFHYELFIREYKNLYEKVKN